MPRELQIGEICHDASFPSGETGDNGSSVSERNAICKYKYVEHHEYVNVAQLHQLAY